MFCLQFSSFFHGVTLCSYHLNLCVIVFLCFVLFYCCVTSTKENEFLPFFAWYLTYHWYQQVFPGAFFGCQNLFFVCLFVCLFVCVCVCACVLVLNNGYQNCCKSCTYWDLWALDIVSYVICTESWSILKQCKVGDSMVRLFLCDTRVVRTCAHTFSVACFFADTAHSVAPQIACWVLKIITYDLYIIG